MIFEVGRYYRHTTGKEIHVIGGPVETTYYMGPALVAEILGNGEPCFVGSSEESAVNWVECEPWIVIDHGVYSAR